MAKRPSLIKQVKDVLDKLARFGQSKHQEKENKKLQAKALGLKGFNPARVDGIYSIVTVKTYCRECINKVLTKENMKDFLQKFYNL